MRVSVVVASRGHKKGCLSLVVGHVLFGEFAFDVVSLHAMGLPAKGGLSHFRGTSAYPERLYQKDTPPRSNLLEVQQDTRHRDTSQLQIYYDRLDKQKTPAVFYETFNL